MSAPLIAQGIRQSDLRQHGIYAALAFQLKESGNAAGNESKAEYLAAPVHLRR